MRSFPLMQIRGGAVISPSTLMLTSAQVQAVMLGIRNTTTNASRIYGYASAETVFAFLVNGTSAVLHLWSDGGDDGSLCSVSVDGGAFANVAASSGDAHPIFFGLANTTHVVLVKYGSAYANYPYISSSGTVLELTGAPPSMYTPAAWLDALNSTNVVGSVLKVANVTNYTPTNMPGQGASTMYSRPSLQFTGSPTRLDIVNGSKYVFVSVDGAAPTRYDLGGAVFPAGAAGYVRITCDGTQHRYNIWRDMGLSANAFEHLYVGTDVAPVAHTAGRLEQWGDSITYGAGSSNTGAVDTYQVGAALGYTGAAYGISGYTTAQLATSIASWMSAKVSDPTNDVCVIAIGRNDVPTWSAAIATNYTTILNAVLPYYKKVLCRGVWPDSSGPYTAYNSGMQSFIAGFGNAKVVYIDPTTWTGITTADGTHPTDAGYVTLAGYAKTAYAPYA